MTRVTARPPSVNYNPKAPLCAPREVAGSRPIGQADGVSILVSDSEPSPSEPAHNARGRTTPRTWRANNRLTPATSGAAKSGTRKTHHLKLKLELSGVRDVTTPNLNSSRSDASARARHGSDAGASRRKSPTCCPARPREPCDSNGLPQVQRQADGSL